MCSLKYMYVKKTKHFEISFRLDAYNFGTYGVPLTPWGGGGTYNLFLFFLVDYRYTYLDINCK